MTNAKRTGNLLLQNSNIKAPHLVYSYFTVNFVYLHIHGHRTDITDIVQPLPYAVQVILYCLTTNSIINKK